MSHEPTSASIESNEVKRQRAQASEWERAGTDASPSEQEPGSPQDLSELLEEVRILQQSAQMLTAFLILLPFSAGFAKIGPLERWIYLATFLAAVTSLVCLSAPAAQHRLERPLLDREQFKNAATRTVLVGLACLSLALGLATLLVVTEVLGILAGRLVALVVSASIAVLWWTVPLWRRARRHAGRGGTA